MNVNVNCGNMDKVYTDFATIQIMINDLKQKVDSEKDVYSRGGRVNEDFLKESLVCIREMANEIWDMLNLFEQSIKQEDLSGKHRMVTVLHITLTHELGEILREYNFLLGSIKPNIYTLSMDPKQARVHLKRLQEQRKVILRLEESLLKVVTHCKYMQVAVKKRRKTIAKIHSALKSQLAVMTEKASIIQGEIKKALRAQRKKRLIIAGVSLAITAVIIVAAVSVLL